jgi:hypothetical protein
MSKDKEIFTLDTQSFPIKKHWLVAALQETRVNPTIYSSAGTLSDFRKKFLAGTNQRSAIRNWLMRSGLIKGSGKNIKLTDLGESIQSNDPQANTALTWWLFHIHLCANQAFPYSSLFVSFDVDESWMALADILQALREEAKRLGLSLADDTVDTYFAGVDASFRAGQMLFMLGLIERRESKQNGIPITLIRRASVRPCKELIVYTALLLQRLNFKGQATVATPDLFKCGFARILGIREPDLRDQLNEMRHDNNCSLFIEYTRKQDLDSIHFRRQGSAPLADLREHCYSSGAVKWK